MIIKYVKFELYFNSKSIFMKILLMSFFSLLTMLCFSQDKKLDQLESELANYVRAENYVQADVIQKQIEAIKTDPENPNAKLSALMVNTNTDKSGPILLSNKKNRFVPASKTLLRISGLGMP